MPKINFIGRIQERHGEASNEITGHSKDNNVFNHIHFWEHQCTITTIVQSHLINVHCALITWPKTKPANPQFVLISSYMFEPDQTTQNPPNQPTFRNTECALCIANVCSIQRRISNKAASQLVFARHKQSVASKWWSYHDDIGRLNIEVSTHYFPQYR